jgi:hypothetical protein
MSQTPPTPATEWSSVGRSALILSAIAAAVFGLLASCGAGLRGFSLPEPAHLDWPFTALAWISITLAPVLAWIFVGLVAFVGGIALWTRGLRPGPRPLESVLATVMTIAFYALAPVVLLSIGPFVLWPIIWFETGFGTCVPPTCNAVPAVP